MRLTPLNVCYVCSAGFTVVLLLVFACLFGWAFDKWQTHHRCEQAFSRMIVNDACTAEDIFCYIDRRLIFTEKAPTHAIERECADIWTAWSRPQPLVPPSSTIEPVGLRLE